MEHALKTGVAGEGWGEDRDRGSFALILSSITRITTSITYQLLSTHPNPPLPTLI